MAFNVSGSITVKRLRTGAMLTLYFTSNGNALQQFVNTDTGDVYPDWTIEENQPIITPTAISSTGGAVYISADGSNQGWKYNGGQIEFGTTTTSEGWQISTNFDGAFARDPDTYALRIIKNLASKTNYASDTLEFTCTVTYEGYESTMARSIDVTILQSTTSGFQGTLSTTTTVLNADVTSTDIVAQLFNGVSYTTGFYTKWYTDFVDSSNLFTEKGAGGTDNKVTITVDRDDVNGGDNNDNQTGGTLFICEFYASQGDSSPVATAAINIADEADELSLILTLTGEQTLSDSNTVVVQGGIFSLTAQSDITKSAKITAIDWVFTVLKPDLTVKRQVSVSTANDYATISVTADDSEENGDVNVTATAEVTFNL